MALNAKRSPKPVETVPISTNVQDQQQEVRVGASESGHKKSESGEGFEILNDAEIAEVKGLGLGLDDDTGSSIARRNSPSLNGSRESSYGPLGLRPPSGKASPDGTISRSPTSSPRPEHRRKSSISSLIAGALIPREKSPGPKEEVSQTNEADVSTIKSRKKDKAGPPAVASKPGWLKRTASAGKIMITGGSSKESSPLASPLTTQPPSLPPRKAATSSSKQDKKGSDSKSASATPKLPKRRSPAASISIPAGKPSIHLDHRASLAVDTRDLHVQHNGNHGLKAAASFEDSLLPPPSRSSVHLPLPSDSSRGHHSLDAPRVLSQVGANGLTTVNPAGLASGLRSGLGVVNRRIGAWSQETGAANNTKGYLQAGGGAIGSAVSSGWSAFRSAKSSAPPSSMSSGIGYMGGRSASNMSLATNSGAVALDMNGMDGPRIEPSLFKRQAPVAGVKGEVFGRDLKDAASFWPVVDHDAQPESSTSGRKRRIASLPAVAVRCVDHLCIWAPQEEGIFRVSGRSSHIALLRKHFDAGADVDLVPCDPGDIDPHAVASLYKSYLRELPTPILTSLFNEFDEIMTTFNGCSAQDQGYMTAIGDAMAGQASLLTLGKRDKDLAATQAERRQSLLNEMRGQMARSLAKLPDENWWLLADLARLLALTDQHRSTNKMTMQNLLMVFCPSLNLSPPFLRYLAENHKSLFREAEETHTLINNIIVTSPSIASIASPGSSQHDHNDTANYGRTNRPTPTSPKSIRDSPKINIPDAFSHDQDPSANSQIQRSATPIADLFKRAGPVEIELRGKPADSS